MTEMPRNFPKLQQGVQSEERLERRWTTITAKGLSAKLIKGFVILGMSSPGIISPLAKYVDMRSKGQPIAYCDENGGRPAGEPLCTYNWSQSQFYRFYMQWKQQQPEGYQMTDAELKKHVIEELAKEHQVSSSNNDRTPAATRKAANPRPAKVKANRAEKSQPAKGFGPGDVFK